MTGSIGWYRSQFALGFSLHPEGGPGNAVVMALKLGLQFTSFPKDLSQ
jgi:hypothetical protein